MFGNIGVVVVISFICVSGDQLTKGIKDLARLPVLISYMRLISYRPSLQTPPLSLAPGLSIGKDSFEPPWWSSHEAIKSVFGSSSCFCFYLTQKEGSLSTAHCDNWCIVSIRERNGMEHIYQDLTGSFRPEFSCQSRLIIDLSTDASLVLRRGNILPYCRPNT